MAPFADPEAVDVTQPDTKEVARVRLRGLGSPLGSPASVRVASLPPVGPGSASPDASPRTSLIAKPDLSPGLVLPPVGVAAPSTAIGRGGQPANSAPTFSTAPAGLPRDLVSWNNLKASPSGIAKLHATAKNPFVRTLENIGIGGLRALDVAGSAVAPGIAEDIPGTSRHHALLENQAAGKVARDLGQEQVQAQTEEALAKAHSLENPAGDAKDWDVREATDANGKPTLVRINKLTGDVQPLSGYQPKPAISRNPMVHETDQGLILVHPDGTTTPLTMGGKPLMPKTPAGNFEEQTYQEWKQTHPNGTREEFAREYAANTRKPEEGSWQLAEDDKGNTVEYNTKTGQGRPAPPNLRPRGAGHVDAATKAKVLTYWQPALDSAERFNVMARNYQDALKEHDQQAMLSLLANHLGMTMGLQKGSRLTRDIIREAEQSRPWLQGLQAKFDRNGYLTGVVLTPQQMAQMMTLAEGRYSQDVAKSRSMAGYVGVTDEPERKLSREGAAYYLNISNGDKDKARDAARADGWQF